jgi:hypothetical protein
MFMRPHLKKAGHVVSACHPRVSRKPKVGDHGPGDLGKNQDPISKITRAKRAGGMT